MPHSRLMERARCLTVLAALWLAVLAFGCTPEGDGGGAGTGADAQGDPGAPSSGDLGMSEADAGDAMAAPMADARPIPRDMGPAAPADMGIAPPADIGAPAPADMGSVAPRRPRLFIIAGQSNAEGNAFYTGLQQLANGLPAGNDPLSPQQRQAARQLIAESQGGWCSPEDFRENTADTVIDHLRSTALDWRRLDLAYRHPTVRIRARQYDYAPVGIQMADGRDVLRCDDCDDPACDFSPADGTLVGPALNMYTDDRLSPLAVGFGIAEDPEEGKSYGPELSFGHAIGETYEDAIVFKMAMGGSSLGDHWRLDGPMYQTLIEGIEQALTEHDATLGGFVWFQGFNDQFENAYCDPLTPLYQGNLRRFLESVREDLATPVPMVIVKARNSGNLFEIQEAQDAVAAALDGVETVETSDTSECFHYDSGAQIVIGERIAAAMVELLAR